jgi:hypothetical protein
MYRTSSARPGIRALPVLLAITMVVALTAVVAQLWWGDTGAPSRDNSARTSETTNQSPGDASATAQSEGNADAPANGEGEAAGSEFQLATKLHENNAAGYSFRYPNRWKLRSEETVSKLTRPDRHFVISFGLGPQGGLPVAYDEFVALLDSTYGNVVVNKVNPTKVGDNVGVLVKGAATGSAGVRVRFLAAVISRPDDKRAIGALAATDTNTTKFPRAVREILDSLRPI